MTLSAYYETGTVSITSGAAAIVGVGTAFLTYGIQVGDKFVRDGYSIPISAVTDDTHLTLEYNYPGTTLAGATYKVEMIPDLTRVLTATTTLIQSLADSGNIDAFAALSGLADKLPYFTGAGAMALSDLPATARQFLAAAAKASNQVTNAGLAASVGASALTVALKQADGSTDPTSTLPCIIGFRDPTLASGNFNQRLVTGALSLTIPSTATMGQTSAIAANLYVYAIDYNAGTVELAVSGYDFGDSGRQSTTALDTASDSATVMYSTTARSNVPFRKIGVLINTQATAGTWATAPSEPRLAPFADAESEAFKTIKDDATTAAMLTTLGLTANAQSLVTAADYAAMLTTLGLTANAQSLVTAADYAAMKTLLGLGTMATQNANAVAITGGSATGLTGIGVNIGPNPDVPGTDASISTASGGTIVGLSVYGSSTASRIALRVQNSNGVIGTIVGTASATAYNTSSDERLKENFADFDTGTIIDALRVYRYDWKAGGSGYGPKAQELWTVFPDAVTVGSIGDAPKDKSFMPWSWDAGKLMPVVLRELQHLRARVAALEAK